MAEDPPPPAIAAVAVPAAAGRTAYPAPFAARVAGRERRVLGDFFGLANFGVNLTRLVPGAISALRHAHSRQDEFIYVLEGEPTLIVDRGETVLRPGMCAGFRAGSDEGHHLVNRTARDAVYLEIGDRSAGDEVVYPDDDIAGGASPDGRTRRFTRKDGTPFP
ncbi:MAG TPA: cupin domain-containing protein [Stellaceae bacterium]|nr:cupin domain-containing protein [Stellaceae bacterium]